MVQIRADQFIQDFCHRLLGQRVQGSPVGIGLPVYCASRWASAMFATITLATGLADHLVLRPNRQAPLGDDGSMPTHDRRQRSSQHPVREGAGEPTYRGQSSAVQITAMPGRNLRCARGGNSKESERRQAKRADGRPRRAGVPHL